MALLSWINDGSMPLHLDAGCSIWLLVGDCDYYSMKKVYLGAVPLFLILFVFVISLSVPQGALHAALVEAIRPHISTLRISPYGKKVLSCINVKK